MQLDMFHRLLSLFKGTNKQERDRRIIRTLKRLNERKRATHSRQTRK